jgi:hypothetical protein
MLLGSDPSWLKILLVDKDGITRCVLKEKTVYWILIEKWVNILKMNNGSCSILQYIATLAFNPS